MSEYDVADYRVNSIAVALGVPYFLVDDETGQIREYSEDEDVFERQVKEDADELGVPIEELREALHLVFPDRFPGDVPDLRPQLARQRYETVVLPTSGDPSLLTNAFFDYQTEFLNDAFLLESGWGTVWEREPRFFFGEPTFERELVRVRWDLQGLAPIDIFNRFRTTREFPAVALFDGERLIRRSRLGFDVPVLKEQESALQIIREDRSIFLLRFLTDEGRLVSGDGSHEVGRTTVSYR